MMFGGHYRAWRRRRVRAIERYYGREWFAGKSVLELGCGHGDIGGHFARLDANVTVSDARGKHLVEAAKRHPEVQKFVCTDAASEWVFGRGWDLIIDMGLLYHLPDLGVVLWHLDNVCGACKHLVLESEVSRHGFVRAESGYDQSIYGYGYRPSEVQVEGALKWKGFEWERVTDGRCNGGGHRYDWEWDEVEGDWESKRRRMWFARSADLSARDERSPIARRSGVPNIPPTSMHWLASGSAGAERTR